MKYKLLANTGLYVSELCCGTMTFGGNGFWSVIGQVEQSEVTTMVNRCLDGGINFFDTADVYSFGASEEMLGKALVEKRKDAIIATKVNGRMGKGPNEVGLSRVHIMNEVHGSLRRLKTDYIDLYQIHGFDPLTDMETILRTLDDLVRSGKVRYIGCSNVTAWQLMKFLGISQFKNLEPFISLQAYYSIAGRDLEREIVPLLKDQNLSLMVWSPLAGGFLSGKYTRDSISDDGARRVNFDFPPVDKERAYTIIDTLHKIAQTKKATVAQIALAWLLHQDIVTSVIIGARRLEQLSENIKATDVSLSPEELKQLNDISQLKAEYPGWFFDVQRQTNQRHPPT